MQYSVKQTTSDAIFGSRNQYIKERTMMQENQHPNKNSSELLSRKPSFENQQPLRPSSTSDSRQSLVQKYRQRVLDAKNNQLSFDLLMGHGHQQYDPLTGKEIFNAPV